MATKQWHIDITYINWKNKLEEAAQLLKDKQQIAFPTETVYGLGADATSDKAVAGIFSAKGRPSDNPLIVHIYDRQQVNELAVHVTDTAKRLMDQFWPGPLTLVLPVKKNKLSKLVTAGLDTVGIRMPDHPIALELLKQAGCPIAAPSANTSGRPSPTLAEHVFEDLHGAIAGIVDGGATGLGLESTVVEVVNDEQIRVLRPGGVTIEQLKACCPSAHIDYDIELKNDQAPRAPGMKYTHYAPTGNLVVVQGEASAVSDYIQEQINYYQSEYRCGVLYFDEHHHKKYDQAELAFNMGSIHHMEEAASRLYYALRKFDEEKVQYIWSEASSLDGIGAAFMNRLLKAAGHTVVKV